MARFDESDARYLMVLPSEEEHNHKDDYEAWFAKWTAWLDGENGRFGLILITEPHDHSDEHDDRVRNEEEENAISAMINAFRRDQRERVNNKTIGYASVYNVEMSDDMWRLSKERTARFAAYTFGIRGNMFRSVEEAKAWLDEIAALPPLPLEDVGMKDITTEAKTAIFYGSTTGVTEVVAEQVQQAWRDNYDETVPIVNVGNTAELMALLSYSQIIVGIPTWNVGKLQDDWEIVYPYLDQVDLSGKQIAIFGVGDQYNYSENFQDAVGILGRKFLEQGATLVGYTSTAGYEHSYSVGTDGEQFMGLAIDDVNQPELTAERIQAWVKQIRREFSLSHAVKEAV